MNKISNKEGGKVRAKAPDGPLRRRAFLQYTGAGLAASAFVFGACEDTAQDPSKLAGSNLGKNDNGAARASDDDTVYLGSGDTGILNYAYALEQLEAAFYTMVVADPSFSAMFSEEERMILEDLKDHEVSHREFFRTALGDSAIRDLTPDFSAIDFSSRDSVLATARTFEDLGVAAYNGAGKLLSDVNLLLVAGKIVSVEARHAAAIRDVINPWSTDFSGDDVVDENGLDKALMPSEVLMAAQPFIKDKIDGSELPTS
jgi:hypothetical protein